MNNKVLDLVEEIKESAWYEFHGGHINDQDDLYTFVHEFIDNSVIYNYDCQEYLSNDMDYCFEEHDLYGRPENINQAAYALIYDTFTNEEGWDIWSEMEEVLNEQ